MTPETTARNMNPEEMAPPTTRSLERQGQRDRMGNAIPTPVVAIEKAHQLAEQELAKVQEFADRISTSEMHPGIVAMIEAGRRAMEAEEAKLRAECGVAETMPGIEPVADTVPAPDPESGVRATIHAPAPTELPKTEVPVPTEIPKTEVPANDVLPETVPADTMPATVKMEAQPATVKMDAQPATVKMEVQPPTVKMEPSNPNPEVVPSTEQPAPESSLEESTDDTWHQQVFEKMKGALARGDEMEIRKSLLACEKNVTARVTKRDATLKQLYALPGAERTPTVDAIIDQCEYENAIDRHELMRYQKEVRLWESERALKKLDAEPVATDVAQTPEASQSGEAPASRRALVLQEIEDLKKQIAGHLGAMESLQGLLARTRKLQEELTTKKPKKTTTPSPDQAQALKETDDAGLSDPFADISSLSAGDYDASDSSGYANSSGIGGHGGEEGKEVIRDLFRAMHGDFGSKGH